MFSWRSAINIYHLRLLKRTSMRSIAAFSQRIESWLKAVVTGSDGG